MQEDNTIDTDTTWAQSYFREPGNWHATDPISTQTQPDFITVLYNVTVPLLHRFLHILKFDTNRAHLHELAAVISRDEQEQ